MIKRFVLVALPVLAFAACGGGDSTDSFNDFISAQDRLLTKVCSCDPNPSMCESENGTSATEQSCIEGVLADHDTAELRDAIDCLVDATNDLVDCLNPVTCDDMTTAAEDCFDAADAAEEACPSVPAAVDAEIESTCFPE